MPSLPNRIWKIPVRVLRTLQEWGSEISIGGVSLGDYFGTWSVDLDEFGLPVVGVSVLALIYHFVRPFRKIERAYARRYTREIRAEPSTLVVTGGPAQIRRKCAKEHCSYENPCSTCGEEAEQFNTQRRRDHKRKQEERRRERERREATIRYQVSAKWRRFRRWLYTA